MEKKQEKRKKKIRMKIVATTSLPAVDRPNADRWNAARSRQNCLDYRVHGIQTDWLGLTVSTKKYRNAEYTAAACKFWGGKKFFGV